MAGYLFQQNMRVFGGGAQNRNQAYDNAFGQILAGLGGPIAVAGFTEVMNNQAAAVALGGANGLCAALGTQLAAVISCGRMALANDDEFIGIGVHANVQILGYGRILINTDDGFQLFADRLNNMANLNAWAAAVPDEATLDYRGLVYVVVTIPQFFGGANANVTVAIGFLHNRQPGADATTLTAQNIGNMMALMLQDPNLPQNPDGYIGGDYNVGPLTRGIARVYYQANTPTTIGNNTYDYWYFNHAPNNAPNAPLIVPVPTVNAITMNVGAGMSDHAAILLRII